MARMMRRDGGGISLTMHCAAMVWFPRELTDAVMYYTQWIRVSELGTKESTHRVKQKQNLN